MKLHQGNAYQKWSDKVIALARVSANRRGITLKPADEPDIRVLRKSVCPVVRSTPPRSTTTQIWIKHERGRVGVTLTGTNMARYFLTSNFQALGQADGQVSLPFRLGAHNTAAS